MVEGALAHVLLKDLSNDAWIEGFFVSNSKTQILQDIDFDFIRVGSMDFVSSWYVSDFRVLRPSQVWEIPQNHRNARLYI